MSGRLLAAHFSRHQSSFGGFTIEIFVFTSVFTHWFDLGGAQWVKI